MSIVQPPGPRGDRQLAILRRACEFQLYALLFALPFEYYFRGRAQTLFSSLKLQILFFIVAWIGLKFGEVLQGSTATWHRFRCSLPGRLLLALAAFVLAQAVAAALASEFSGNALKAAVKAGLGALLAIAAADLATGSQLRSRHGNNTVRNSVVALSLSGAFTALLGLGEFAGFRFCAKIVHLFQTSEFFLVNRLRFVSTMEYPNTAGSFLSAALCASLALAIFPITGNNRLRRALWLALAATQGSALALTLSRGAIGSTMFAILAATWISWGPVGGEKRQKIIAACFAAMLLGLSAWCLAHRGAVREGAPSGKRLARWELKSAGEIGHLLADHCYVEEVIVENASPDQWQGGDCGVGYRWYSISNDQTQPLAAGAPFTAAVAPGQQARIELPLVTPSREGEFLLILFVTCRNGAMRELRDSYSPARLCIVTHPGSASEKRPTEKALHYLEAIRSELGNLDATVAPGRPDLWLAAFRMFRQRPVLGMGPDNFRLLKSKYMDIPVKDERILANNLYLEILSGSGILGLGSFLWLLWEFGRALARKIAAAKSPADRSTACFGVAYLSALALHGIVDYFLKFTPTFLLFWLVLGMLCAGRPGNREPYAHRV